MDYKNLPKYLTVLGFIGILSGFIIGCSDSKKDKSGETIYIELVNFNDDSLKASVSEKIMGKVSFYKNNDIKVLSENYVLEDFDKMHYFKNFDILGKDIKQNTRKIRVEFGGKYTVDSVSVSLQKYTYEADKWVKKSDMGFVKSMLSYSKDKIFSYRYHGEQIVNLVVSYSYN